MVFELLEEEEEEEERLMSTDQSFRFFLPIPTPTHGMKRGS